MRASFVDIVRCNSLREKVGDFLENTCVYKGLRLKSVRKSINQAIFGTRRFFTGRFYCRTYPVTDFQLSRPTPREEFMGKLIDVRENFMTGKRPIFEKAFQLFGDKLQIGRAHV